MEINKWDKRFLEMAKLVSIWSKDQSTKCGAVITKGKFVVSLGYNGFPAGTNDDTALYNDREEKYRRVIHAEKNALLTASQSVRGCTCYVWPMPPCSQCAAALIQAGIKRIVSIQPTAEQLMRWGDDFSSAEDMIDEAGIELFLYEVGEN